MIKESFIKFNASEDNLFEFFFFLIFKLFLSIKVDS